MSLDPELIAQWKDQFGQVYTVEYRGKTYAFRELTFSEYDAAVRVDHDEGTAEAEDKIVEIALLSSKEGFDRIPAGVVTSLAEEVLEVSGFGSPKEAKRKLEAKREQAAQVRGLMKAFVLATMPAYKEEELNNLTFDQLAGKVALAEQIIKVNRAAFGGEGDLELNLIDPEEEAAREAEEEKARAKRQQRAWELMNKGGRLPESDEKPPPIIPKINPNDPIAAKLREAL